MGKKRLTPPSSPTRYEGSIRGVDPRRFSFVGFDDYAPVIADFVASARIMDDIPAVFEYHDITYVPYQWVGNPAIPPVYGELVTPSGVSLLEIVRRTAHKPVLGGIATEQAVEGAEIIEEPVAYLGWIGGIYGHVITESLARAWVVSALEQSMPLLFHTGVEGPFADWIWEILAYHGIDADRVLVPDRAVRFRRLIVPSPELLLRGYVYPSMRQQYERVIDLFPSETPATDQPLYLSRRKLRGAQRVIGNELELEEALASHGFRIVSPELMSFPDQVRMFNQHRLIFGPQGSAAHTVLYSGIKPDLTLLTELKWFNNNYLLASELAEVPTTFINGIVRSNRENQTRGAARFHCDIDAILNHFRSRGIISGSSSSSPIRLADGAEDPGQEMAAPAAAESLPTTAEMRRTLFKRAASDWRFAWAGARSFSDGDLESVQLCIDLFLALVTLEEDSSLLHNYGAVIQLSAPEVLRRCTPVQRPLLEALLEERWSAKPGSDARAERRARRLRREARANARRRASDAEMESPPPTAS